MLIMKMKKVVLFVFALVMCFALVACGENHDKNNAAIQAKVDQADALVEEIISLYEDSGYAEGREEQLDRLRGQMDQVKANHKEILDGGGYDDETAAAFGATVDKGIETYTTLLEKLKADLEAVEGQQEAE